MRYRVIAHTKDGKLQYLKAVGSPLVAEREKAGTWPLATASSLAKVVAQRPAVERTEIEGAR